jgi:hypothetical protein
MSAKLLAVLLASVGVTLAPSPVLAHHSFAGSYFEDQNAKIEGKLVEFDYRSPHSFVIVDVADSRTGETVRWAVEWRSGARLGREGVTKETLKPGDRVIVIGHPGRNLDEHRLHMWGISRPSDGWKYGHATD